jgi:glycosyltransferase involved in cell wall biosynthesis
MGLTLLDLTEVPSSFAIETVSAEILSYLAVNRIDPRQVVISCEENSEISVQDLKIIALACGLNDSLVGWRRPLRRSIIRKSPQIADGLLELLGIHVGALKIVKVSSETDSKINFVEVIQNTYNTVFEDVLSEIPSLNPNLFSRVELRELSRSMSVVWPSSRKPRVFVDVSSIIKNDLGTGIQRVIRNLIPEVIDVLPDSFELALISADENGGPFHYVDFSAGQQSDEIKFKRRQEVVEFIRSDIFLGLDLNYGVTLSHSNYFSKLQRRGVKLVALIYDLLPVQFPHFFPKEVTTLSLHERYLGVLSTFDVAISISQAVENDYIDWVKSNNPSVLEIQVTGHIPLGSRLADGDSTKSPLDYGDFFMHVGTLEPRKNVAQILDAFEILWRKGSRLNLVLVGKRGWEVEKLITRIISHAEIDRKLFWLQNVDDTQLSNLYRNARCLIMASAGEGYGLPIVEAHSFGLKVLARDIPVFCEVCGPGDRFFDGTTGEGLAGAIENMSSDETALGSVPSPSWKDSSSALITYVLRGKY